MARAWINNWKTTLSAGLSPGELSLTVPDAAAALLPLSGGNWVLLTLADDAGAQHEIVKATARAGGVVTIERAQEATADGNWPAGRRSMQPSRPAISWHCKRESRPLRAALPKEPWSMRAVRLSSMAPETT
nr:hypothetical protein [Pseudomonas aeruginosa]